MQSMKMSHLKGIALASMAMLVAAPAFSQTVSFYTGTLAIGFGDPANQPQNGGDDFANNGVPACANANPFVPATIASLGVAGFLEQGGAAPRASVMFGGYAPPDFTNDTGGGQEPIVDSTCIVQFPPFLGNQLRSRVQFGSQVWPGNALNGALTAATGAPGGTLSTGNANPAAASFSPTNFYVTGMSGMQFISPPVGGGFGGGVPVNGNGAVQLGVNFLPHTNGAGAPLQTFGIRDYAEGFLPTGPAVYGTDATGGGVPVGVRASNAYTWRVHTPGPTGTAGNIPLTANLGWQQGATQMAGPADLTTMGDFAGIFQKWTTGAVRHTDMSGMYTTDRAATGHDWTTAQFASNATTAMFGTTRKLQLVTPWSASIRKRGTGPFAIALAAPPACGFGGLAILTLDITPVPEPGTLSMLGFGAMGLLGLGAMRRRNS